MITDFVTFLLIVGIIKNKIKINSISILFVCIETARNSVDDR